MKRILCVLLAVLMVCGLCACGKEAPKADTADKGGDTTSATEGSTTTTTGEGGTTATVGDSTTTGDGTAIPTTTATKTPTSTKGETEESAIRVLAIGDGFAVDAMEKYLYEMLKSAGYDSIHLGLLYADKSNLDQNYTNVKSDKAVYEFRQNTNGKWTKESKTAPSKAFKAAKWDYVIVQQSGADSGMPASYGKLGDLTALLQKQCSDATIYWHMTWAFQQNSNAEGFANYDYHQKSMYQAIVKAALQQVMGDPNIQALIPTGTTIQNLRTSGLRDTLTTDGARLIDTYGDYAAALTWYCSLTGEDADTVSYRPAAVKDHHEEIVEAVQNAMSVPNEVTSTTQGDGEYRDLRILSIGHSFSLDAMRTYMWDLFDAAGYSVTIGYLYYPSCSLEQHWHYINENRAEYEQYGKNKNGEWDTQYNVDALTALWDEDWDIVTFQPDPDFGYDKFLNNVPCRCDWGCGANIVSDYMHFDQLVDKVLSILADPKNPNGPNTDVKVYYHLTWTFRADCYLGKYLYPKGYDQLTLYQDFIAATQKYILPNEHIQGVIPCNTSIENARTSFMGDTFNAEGSNDGYHLNDKGDLTAALTWVSYFTGVKAANIHFRTSYSAEEWNAIAEAVDNAIANQWEVTQSSYKTKP